MIPKKKPQIERKKTLEEYISKKRLKSTRQRDIIFEEFFKSPNHHATVDEIYYNVRRNHPGIGYATIYRTLKLFKECGLAKERNFGDGKTRYEPVKSEGDHHDHLICIECGKIICYKNPRIEQYSQEVAQMNHFEVVNYKVELYGYCAECK